MAFGARPFGSRGFGDSTGDTGAGLNLPSVGTDYELLWDVHERTQVNADKDLRWSVAANVGANKDLRWRVYLLTGDNTGLWWQIAPMPAPEALDAIYETGSKVIRYVEIYESDGITLYKDKTQVDLVGGSVNGDTAREERLACQLTLANVDQELQIMPGEFWYDKVIKIYRGVQYQHDLGGFLGFETVDGVTILGTFMIDQISSPRFPGTIEISGRDFSKKLKLSKFRVSTTFTEGSALEDVLKAIAISGGVEPTQIMDLVTHVTLNRDFVFESGTERWTAIQEIVKAHGWQAWFTRSGLFTWQIYFDPSEFDGFYAFSTGWRGAVFTDNPRNMVTYQKNRRDIRIYNTVVVTGESANGPLVYGEAVNDDPASPTSVQELGERLYKYSTPNVTTNAEALALAERLLDVQGIEEFDVSVESIVLPWAQAGDIVDFEEETFLGNNEPFRYVLTNVTIPLGLTTMTSTLKRIVNVSGL